MFRFSLNRLLVAVLAMQGFLLQADPNWLVAPYLQNPTPNSMTVMFETHDLNPRVSFRRLGATTTQTQNAERVKPLGAVYRAALTNLDSATRYEYRVTTSAGDSPWFRFKTWPTETDGVDRFRFIVLSDAQGDWPDRFSDVIENGVIGKECSQGRVTACPDDLAAIIIPGDLVGTGSNITHWRRDFFGKAAAVLPYVPIIPAIGNHDYELGNFLTYFDLPDNGSGSYNEQWYYLDYANFRLVGLNSNDGRDSTLNREQRAWFSQLLQQAQQDPALDYLFVSIHHPCQSELWPPGESDLTCEYVGMLENLSAQTGKITGHLFGHTHGYSRGQSRDVRHLWLNAATTAGDIDYWGEYAQKDYDHFQKSYDEYGFSILTFSAQGEPSLAVRRRTGGDDSVYHGYSDESQRDDFIIGGLNRLPQRPIPLAPAGEIVGLQTTLVASPFDDADNDPHLESHWQLQRAEDGALVAEAWGNETRRENIYFDADTQAGADLTRWRTPYLAAATHYVWRVRYRDDRWGWSPWSQDAVFSTPALQTTPNLVRNGAAEAGTDGWQVHEGFLESLSAGECNGINPQSGDRYFAVGGVCREAARARATQRIDVTAYAAAIDGGQARLRLSVWLADWNGNDRPSVHLRFLDSGGVVLAEGLSVSRQAPEWAAQTAGTLLPANTRWLEVELLGERFAGTDNDSYVDDLDLRLLLPNGSGPGLPSGNLVANGGAENETDAWETRAGHLESLSAGECRGTDPFEGARYFAVGALCREAAFAHAVQRIDLRTYAEAIGAGATVRFQAALRNWSGNDIPAAYLVFLDAAGNELQTTVPLQHDQAVWRVLEQSTTLPVETGFIEVHLEGTRHAGTDNDAYVDSLDLRFVR
ncbi:fibronectin type III domain-containing protein [Acanthopleuribacter pedis]|uniref:Metallophosphoesterase n=1 Tax=Acanthopleuribacter pedis TaxID=442870 RepID=A0A8J7U2Q0_9BACT|nr:fibronectin type III domain-containing protein [Acanthopleuribacter pedis]MBO1317954.1 metallophosphoesterase [Acanthopleuribacter pedis]